MKETRLMARTMTVAAATRQRERDWVADLQEQLKVLPGFQVKAFEEGEPYGDIILVDSAIKDLSSLLSTIDRKRKIILLVKGIPKASQVDPEELLKSSFGLVEKENLDDILSHPFRILEVVSKIRSYEQKLRWHEVSELSQSFAGLSRKLEDDFKLTQKIQKSKYPKKFGFVKGYRVVSRYLAGMASGGDYFDMAESSDRHHLSMILTQSSSYGLSSAILTVLTRVMLKLSSDRLEVSGAPDRIIREIYDEILVSLGPKDQLSVCYGIISRSTQTFRYLNLGSTAIFHSAPISKTQPPSDGAFHLLPTAGEPIVAGSLRGDDLLEQTLNLAQGSRLVFVSRGVLEALGGTAEVASILNRVETSDTLDALNELIYAVKSKLGPDDMPARDCTVLLLEVELPALQILPPR